MKMLSKVMRTSVSVLLILAMMLSTCSTVISSAVDDSEAALVKKDVINYVSLGDSMTNGYGLDGYNEGEVGVNGYLQNDTDAYPSQFAKWLVSAGYAEKVNHDQLAISCMRAEDLRFILELDYEDTEVVDFINKIHNAGLDFDLIEDDWYNIIGVGDKFTYDEFVDGRFDDWDDAGHIGYNTLDYAKQFQDSVTDADIISIGTGNANFGVFLLHRVVDAVGILGHDPDSYEWIDVEDAFDDVDADIKAAALELYAELKSQIPVDAPSVAEAIVDLITYTTVSYMTNYKGALDRITELSDGADIIIVGLMNTMSGVEINYEGKIIDLGGYMDTALATVSNYLAGLAAVQQAIKTDSYLDHTFYFAEASNVDMIVSEMATAKEAAWVGYGIVRDRIVTEVVDTVFPMLNMGLPEITLKDIENYETALGSSAAFAGYLAKNSAAHAQACAIYLAFERATVASSELKQLDASSFMKLVTGIDGIFEGVFKAYNEKVSVEGIKHAEMAGEVYTYLEGKVDIPTLCGLLATPEALNQALIEDDTVYSLLNLFARMLVGNGIGCHPSNDGHDTLAAEVIKTYREGYTVQDETLNNIAVALAAMQALAVEYYDEAYAEAYRYADENGYIDTAVSVLNDLKNDIISLKAEVNIGYMSDEFKAELLSELDLAADTVDDAICLISTADALDGETFNTALNLLTSLESNLDKVLNLLDIASDDAGEYIYTEAMKMATEINRRWQVEWKPALEAAVDVLAEQVREYLSKVLSEVYNTLEEAVSAAVKKYAPEAAKWVYSYLLNNPDKIIEFVTEYGPYAVMFAETYSEEILSALAYIGVNYGDEVVNYILEDPEERLSVLCGIVSEYGDRAWVLIEVYADVLGLSVYLEEKLTYIENVADEELEKLESVLATLKSELETYKDELKNASEDLCADLEEIIADIDKAIAELEAGTDIEGLASAVESIAESAKSVADKAYTEVKGAVEEVIYDATHADYVKDKNSFYIALGDSSVCGEGNYAEKLAQTLGFTDKTFINLSSEGLPVSDTYSVIEANSDIISAADLITIGYSSNAFTSEAIERINNIMVGDAVTNYDWSIYVGDKGVAYVEAALSDIRTEFAAQGLDIIVGGRNIADMITLFVEAYAYSFVAHECSYPEVVNAIHAVNSDALVVIVGLYNTLEDIVVDVEGVEIALGEYVRYMVDAANIQSLIYAVLTDNTVYVDAPDVETVKEASGEALGYDLVGFVWDMLLTDGSELLASEVGHEYIKEQIINALDVTVIEYKEYLLGDVNLDGEVNSSDANLVYRFVQEDDSLEAFGAVELLVADVNQDGEINSSDANILYRYVKEDSSLSWEPVCVEAE